MGDAQKNISADEATVEADAKGYRRFIKEANVDKFHLLSDEERERERERALGV